MLPGRREIQHQLIAYHPEATGQIVVVVVVVAEKLVALPLGHNKLVLLLTHEIRQLELVLIVEAVDFDSAQRLVYLFAFFVKWDSVLRLFGVFGWAGELF